MRDDEGGLYILETKGRFLKNERVLEPGWVILTNLTRVKSNDDRWCRIIFKFECPYTYLKKKKKKGRETLLSSRNLMRPMG